METDAGVDARLNAEWISSAASFATLLVVAITAYAALRQMRHMRSGNQVAALLPLIHHYRSDELQQSLRYVFREMNADLEIPENRQGVIANPMQGPCRAALPYINFCEMCGSLVCGGVIDLGVLLRYMPRASEAWSRSEDFVALSRKTRGTAAYEMFEAMVALEARYVARHGTSMYPKNLPRVPPRERTFGS